MHTLSEAQHLRLDSLAEEYPDAKVIGWRAGGPLIRSGQHGAVRRLTIHGRLVPAVHLTPPYDDV